MEGTLPAWPRGSARETAAGPSRPGENGTYPGGRPASALRRDILLALRQNGASSPDALAAHLGASRTGVLQQLRALESADLVTRQTVRHGVGRPRHLYDVTVGAQELFPANYEGLAEGLVQAVAEVGGPELIEQVFLARSRQLAGRIRLRLDERVGADASLAARARELAVFQDEQGYLCEAITGDDGELRLREHNCAIFHVSAAYPAACQAELDLFREVLGAHVEREKHIVAGDRCCSYLIRPAPSRRRSA